MASSPPSPLFDHAPFSLSRWGGEARSVGSLRSVGGGGVRKMRSPGYLLPPSIK